MPLFPSHHSPHSRAFVSLFSICRLACCSIHFQSLLRLSLEDCVVALFVFSTAFHILTPSRRTHTATHTRFAHYGQIKFPLCALFCAPTPPPTIRWCSTVYATGFSMCSVFADVFFLVSHMIAARRAREYPAVVCPCLHVELLLAEFFSLLDSLAARYSRQHHIIIRIHVYIFVPTYL